MRGLKPLLSLVAVALLASCSRAPVADETAENTPAPTVKTGDIVVAGYEAPDEPSPESTDEGTSATTTEPSSPKTISPQAWARLHLVALQSGSPAWRGAIEELQIVG